MYRTVSSRSSSSSSNSTSVGQQGTPSFSMLKKCLRYWFVVIALNLAISTTGVESFVPTATASATTNTDTNTNIHNNSNSNSNNNSPLHLKMTGGAANTAAAAAAAAPNAIKVCVIGAGAAGLTAARVLSRNGIQTTVLEKSPNHRVSDSNSDHGVGGVWKYNVNSKTKPMYRGLRTNLPREIMAYREKKWGGDGVSMSYVTHEDVAGYLKGYATDFNLEQYISFDSTVKQLKVCTDEKSKYQNKYQNKNDSDHGVDNDVNDDDDDDDDDAPWPKVSIEWEDTRTKQSTKQTFDAVCICNGHYAKPATPKIEGMEHFQGQIIHSIEYDDPAIFAGKTVLCVGGRASGSDLAREISEHAKTVYLSDTTCPEDRITEGNVSWVPRTLSIDENSCIHFDKASSSSSSSSSLSTTANNVDIIILCSGYDYDFPFINEKSNMELKVIPGERRVSPLYEQLWHAEYPNIAFIGLQHSVLPFPFFELQAEAIVKQILENARDIPANRAERMAAAMADAASGGPKDPGRIQDTHFLGGHQWDWYRKYASYAGLSSSLDKYINTNKAIYDHSNLMRKGLFPGGPDEYRYHSFVRDDENETFSVNTVTKEEAASMKEMSVQ